MLETVDKEKGLKVQNKKLTDELHLVQASFREVSEKLATSDLELSKLKEQKESQDLLLKTMEQRVSRF